MDIFQGNLRIDDIVYLVSISNHVNYNIFFSIPQSVITKAEMMTKLTLEGTVNGHCFMVKGEGKGNPFE